MRLPLRSEAPFLWKYADQDQCLTDSDEQGHDDRYKQGEHDSCIKKHAADSTMTATTRKKETTMKELKLSDPPEQLDAEPFYIAQTGECRTPEERNEWLRARAAEGRKRGCIHGRATLGCQGHPDLLLFEAWKVLPKEEGEPRFQLTAA